MYGNQRFPMICTMYVTIADTMTQAKISMARSGCSVMNRGPACSPWMVSPAISIAVIPSPGIPRAIMGIRAPPRDALLAVSEAHTPAGFPFPKLSGSLLMLFA